MESVTPPPGPGRPASRGVIGEFLGLLGSFGDHIQAMAALAGLEAREAASLYLWAVIFLVLALIFVIFGYAFLILFVAFALAALLELSWIWITLGLALLHVAGAALCLFLVKARIKSPVFTATSAELRKDFESLKNFQP
jgi:uncharacterized membrane protein YqjE